MLYNTFINYSFFAAYGHMYDFGRQVLYVRITTDIVNQVRTITNLCRSPVPTPLLTCPIHRVAPFRTIEVQLGQYAVLSCFSTPRLPPFFLSCFVFFPAFWSAERIYCFGVSFRVIQTLFWVVVSACTRICNVTGGPHDIVLFYPCGRASPTDAPHRFGPPTRPLFVVVTSNVDLEAGVDMEASDVECDRGFRSVMVYMSSTLASCLSGKMCLLINMTLGCVSAEYRKMESRCNTV
jgi:hypothetical protein